MNSIGLYHSALVFHCFRALDPSIEDGKSVAKMQFGLLFNKCGCLCIHPNVRPMGLIAKRGINHNVPFNDRGAMRVYDTFPLQRHFSSYCNIVYGNYIHRSVIYKASFLIFQATDVRSCSDRQVPL